VIKSDLLTIRPAVESDTATLLSLINELAEYEKLSDAVVATEETLRVTLFSGRPAAEALIGELEGRPVAFALFFHNYSTFLGRKGLYLEDLYVQPEYRGRGYGKGMLIRLAQIAVERGCGRFEWSVLDWNSSAIEFYRKLGAVPMDEWTVFRLDGTALAALSIPRKDE
jgi:GNAT superfamily N-acetyltransferase